jgi:cardiolipin synthase
MSLTSGDGSPGRAAPAAPRTPRIGHGPTGLPRRWRHRLAPKLRGRPKGRESAWKHIRRAIWWWWPWAIAALVSAYFDHWGRAAGFGIAAIVTYLVTPGETPPRYGLDHEFAIDSDEFLATVGGASGAAFLPGNAVEILNTGDAFYPRMLEDIGRAQASITVEAYIYWAGEIGLTFARAFAAKAQEGVPVKLLLDAVGSATIGEEILQTLERGGCQLAWYNPIHFYTIGRFNHRTHRKSLIIDGQIAYTGGAGIADHWLGNAEDKDHWRDMQIRLSGPAVAPLQTGFAHNWQQTTSELVSGAAFYPVIDPAGSLPAMTLISSPEAGASSVRTMYYLSIACARKSIDIANPYFVPDEVAIESLVDAQRRGVKVRLIVSGVHNDSRLARNNSIRLYGQLLAAGVEIYEYNRTMLHHKIMIVDDVWSTIGTANFDNRSFSTNEESNVCFYDRQLAAHLRRVFADDAAASDRVTLEAWQNRGLVSRVAETWASLLEFQV